MKRGTPDHPKVKTLARTLGISWPAAIGTLELLWHFTAKFAIQGNIGRWPNEQIAEAVGWTEEAGTLIAGLIGTGWLDEHDQHRLLVHDWHDHADDSVRKTLKNRELKFFRKTDGIIPDLTGIRTPALPSLALPAPAPSGAAAGFWKDDSPATESLERLLLDRDLPPTLSAWVVSNVPADDIREMLAFYDGECSAGRFKNPVAALKTIVKDPEGKWDFTRNALGRLMRPRAVKSKDAPPTKEEYDEQLRQRRANSPPADGSLTTIGDGISEAQKKLKKGV